MNVRTRFAPSPTGSLHIGGIRTALYCYALAQKHNGSFILRIEDTDQKRFVEGSLEEIFEMLDLYHIPPNEGPTQGGDFGPYIQTERIDLYKKYAMKLVEQGDAYYCFLSGEELETMQKDFMDRGIGFRSPYREMDKKEVQEKINSGEKYVIRMKVPNDETIEYEDGVQGKIEFDSTMVSDQIILKSSGIPTYHLAVVVDDHEMQISHVFRSVEWLTSTPKQILLYRFLNWEMPPFYHPTAILDPETGKKLSKRSGTVSAKAFIEEGYLTEALLNFLMLLGWSAPIEREHGESEKELFSLAEFIDLFDPKDLNKSNPIFDRKKLLWFNKEYLKMIDSNKLGSKVITWLENYAEDNSLLDYVKKDENLEQKLELLKERSNTLVDLVESLRFFYESPKDIDWEIKQLKKVNSDQLSAIRVQIKDLIESFDENSSNWKHEQWEQGMRTIADEFEIKHGDAFMILRVALVGAPFSPPLFESLQILGKEEVLKRL